jgi:hypothetical protein
MGDNPTKPDQLETSFTWDDSIRLFLEIAEKSRDEGDSPKIAMRLIQAYAKFKDDFRRGTADVDNFLSITAMEDLVQKLNEDQRAAGFELLIDEIKRIDEKPVVDKKKPNTKEGG